MVDRLQSESICFCLKMHWPYSIISFLACWFDNIVYENMFQCTHECIPTLSCVLIYLRYVLCYHYDSLPKTCQNMYCPFSTTVGYLRSYAENWTFNLETIMWPDENKCIVCKIHIDHRIEFLGFDWLYNCFCDVLWHIMTLFHPWMVILFWWLKLFPRWLHCLTMPMNMQ